MLVRSVQANHKRYSSCRALPCLMVAVFWANCPVVSALHFSIFIPRSMTSALFLIDVYGSLMLAAFFFQASGSAVAEDAPVDMSCEPKDFWETLGQNIAVGFATVILGMAPSMFVASLHCR